MVRKKLIRGGDDYQHLIVNRGYFVDKTLFIKEVLDNSHIVLLLPCPRRFGKSMNLSILRYFFDINVPNTARLFKPYKIWKAGKTYTDQQGKYPVINLTLKDIEGESFKDCLEFIADIMSELFEDHSYLLESKNLSKREKKDIEQIIDRSASKTILKRSLKKLSRFLNKHFKQPVVILIDEYDSPIHGAYRNGFYSEMIQFMRPFLGGALKTNAVLHKAVVTGVLRVSKESIFSQVNNLGVYTLLDKEFADKFGFTEEETKKMLSHFDLEEKFDLVKNWYDGYRMGDVEDIYNPWSITGYIDRKGEGFFPHWVNTSSDELIKERVVEKSANSIRKDILELLSDKIISKDIDQRIIFRDFSTDKELLWSLLVFSGYLTSSKWKIADRQNLKIPNFEIKQLFQKIIAKWFETGVKINTSVLLQMIDCLMNNRIKEFERYFKSVMGDTFSYFDLDKPNGKRKKEAENVWHAYTLGLLAIANEDYIIRSNRESGSGRYDILMLPKDKSRYGIIFEIKALSKKTTKEVIDNQLDKALSQIQKNEYYKELIAHDIPKRIEIAVVFTGKKVFMKHKNA